MTLSERLARGLRQGHDESGSSLVEFIMLAVLVLIPVIYFILGVAAVQAAAYASLGASDQAARMYVLGGEDLGSDERSARSQAAVTTALADFGIGPEQAEITMSCPAGSCEDDGDVVAFTVEVRVPVPLIPEFGSWRSTLVTVSSTSAQVQAG
ncbi:hypothetical protein I2485_08575 [Nesterenkonia sp. E16_7]|uniref:hypothetical protein n=1 Tax=unclassified Nesterenkonia TaxID=2629769 RepID=UPI001A91037C|nr:MULTISPECIES: hypothetical protein [unclassified Nesterenkonia]MBO0595053.1 hypothetical protein [Nesterenkonia sp. E16_10]MBO0598708.1 hypothetical protein [Nesterenkonia sp. E16_7]